MVASITWISTIIFIISQLDLTQIKQAFMSLLIKNIKSLLQVRNSGDLKVSGNDMAILPRIDHAWIYISNDRIVDYGPMDALDDTISGPDTQIIEAEGKMVMPAFCDSHTHLVFPASREIEYIDKIKGLSYEEIARRGGGILNSAKRMHETSEEALVESARLRLGEIIKLGTGAVEIKSGYGLNTEDELKMLRVIRRLKEESPIEIVASFLGAHAIPAEY
jgi:imidazolonepropionase